MTLAQASVGAAATSPTSGTALMTPELTRQGAATMPQLARATATASSRQNRVTIAVTMNDEPYGNRTRLRRISSERMSPSQLFYCVTALAGLAASKASQNAGIQIGGLHDENHPDFSALKAP